MLDSRRPERGWRKSASLALPVGVSEHCSVVLAGSQGREVIVTGGTGRGDRSAPAPGPDPACPGR